MSNTRKIAIDNLNTFLQKHETLQLALVEAVHRYYYDKCFTDGEGSRFRDDDEAKLISVLHQNLHCARPGWRHDIKRKLERYHGQEKTKALVIDAKPKYQLSISVSVNLVPQENKGHFFQTTQELCSFIRKFYELWRHKTYVLLAREYTENKEA